jgi:parallel beta-helix repeat protein
VQRDDIAIVGPQRRLGRGMVLNAAAGQARGIEVARSREGTCLSQRRKLIDGARIARLTVQGFEHDGIRLTCVERWRVTRVRALDNGEYGVFPVQTRRGRLDHSFASGADDTGLYIGSSRDARVDHNRAIHNVSGFEVENSVGIVVDHNKSRRNTAGILVFALPGLSEPRSAGNVLRDNRVTANNRANTCSEPTEVVCGVPTGTGVLILAADRNRVRDNIVTSNDTVGIAVANYCVVRAIPAAECETLDIDPDPDGNRVIRNLAIGNGDAPDLERLPIPAAAADLAWDTTGTANCWSDNAIGTTFPATLPACS